MDFRIIPTDHGASRLGHIGSVVNVIQADLPEDLLRRRFQAADYAYGFELASPKDKASIGEAVLVNNHCYATSTDTQSSDYQQLLWGPEFISGGMFLIPHAARPSHRFSFKMQNPADSMSFYEAYTRIYAAVKQAFAFVALVHFTVLQGTSIAKAPLNKHNVFDYQDEYYPYPKSLLTHTHAFVMGAAADYRDSRQAALNQSLETVLYKNPFDTDADLTYHAHLLCLRRAVTDFSQVQPEVATKVLHLFAKDSTICAMQGEVYTISALDDYFCAKQQF